MSFIPIMQINCCANLCKCSGGGRAFKSLCSPCEIHSPEIDLAWTGLGRGRHVVCIDSQDRLSAIRPQHAQGRIVFYSRRSVASHAANGWISRGCKKSRSIQSNVGRKIVCPTTRNQHGHGHWTRGHSLFNRWAPRGALVVEFKSDK